MIRISNFFVLVLVVFVASCGVQKTVVKEPVKPPTLYLKLTKQAHQNKYVGMDYGIRLNVKDARASKNILKKYDASAVNKPVVKVSPDVASFTSESMRRYMRTMGFNLDADVRTDYMLIASISEFNVSYLSGLGWSSTVYMNIEVYDNGNNLVYPNVTVVGRANVSGSSKDYSLAENSLNEAFANALEDIDWDRIAFFLKRADNAAEEGNKVVSGKGDTALENTIIRWYIDSAPKGADVSLRVVSSTPDVKNTNQNYVGSTPYETTESFDIKGLTFNNSGDVQIEVTCEKAGYITQKKRFNVRQAIEQEEISTKFNLVKEE